MNLRRERLGREINEVQSHEAEPSLAQLLEPQHTEGESSDHPPTNRGALLWWRFLDPIATRYTWALTIGRLLP
jgi:hypothetical protein